MASEAAQRHVTEIMERDAREMGGLIEAADVVTAGVRTLDQDYNDWEAFYHHMGRLSPSWSIFDEDVFLVSLTSHTFTQ